MEKIKWGIIGAGDVAEVKSGPAFQKAAHSELVAVMRRDGAKAEDFARRHAVPEWYDDAQKILKHPEINAVYIATPPASHEAYAIQALKAGKNVYLEKPMATSLDACQRIVDEVDKSEKKLVVAHYRRALPAFLKVKELLDRQAVGDIRFVQIKILQPAKSKLIAQTETNWRVEPDISGGGLFHDIAPHQLDLMYLYFGKPLHVSGQAFNQASLYPAEDIVSASILFDKNIVFQGLWCFTVPEEEACEYCEIVGEEGSIRFSFYGAEVRLTGKTSETFRFENPVNIQQPMIEQVNRYFRGEADNPCTAAEGLQVMEMLQTASGRK